MGISNAFFETKFLLNAEFKEVNDYKSKYEFQYILFLFFLKIHIHIHNLTSFKSVSSLIYNAQWNRCFNSKYFSCRNLKILKK